MDLLMFIFVVVILIISDGLYLFIFNLKLVTRQICIFLQLKYFILI